MTVVKKISLAFGIGMPIVLTIIALLFDKSPIKRGIIDCHSNSELECYGIFEEGDKTIKYLIVLSKFYDNRFDSIRSSNEYKEYSLNENERKKLENILNGSKSIRIKNHSLVQYRERSVHVYTLEIDSIDTEVVIQPRYIKLLDDE